ncbi:MAG TPA: diguanylate cyclase [Vicinamibacterales bacterium]|nr:diguanylate cyclase [Vicinamibacterales bacterium]
MVIDIQAWWRKALAAGGLYPGAAGLAAAASAFAFATGHPVLSALALALAAVAWRRCVDHARRLGAETRRERQLSEVHLAAIEALALAIDAKDKTASTHIRRVQRFAAALAGAAGMDQDDTAGVTTAALLHDIGKLAVPEHILSKPGPLSDEEFQKIRIHPQVGFEIIEHVPFPYPVAQLVLCHHERWDGKGYPLGLRGEDIPLGARVLAVADYFDSMMRKRPYHESVSRETAVAMLRQEGGRALDPRLVTMFLGLLPGIPDDQDEPAVPTLAVARTVGRRLLETSEHSAFANIARAHEEIYALYDMAQALGSSLGVADTMSLLATKLSALVPFSACALFVREDDEVLRCRFASGVEADQLRRAAVPVGRGLAGWVTRNRRPLVNARPVADFETTDVAPAPLSLRSALVTPLVFNGCVIGTLSVYHTDQDFYREDHRRLLERISDQAAAALSNSITYEKTREASLSDPLTGLPNTRFLFNHLGRELSRAQRLRAPVAILVLDLDHFKGINDTYGHNVGDRALREVARVLRDATRPYDICVRYAGDEFIVVLADCGAEDAESKRIELQQAVDDLAFDVEGGERVKLAISIGAAVFPHDGDTYEALLATADGRMYRDKKVRKRLPAPRPVVREAAVYEGAEAEAAAEIRRFARVS